MSPQNCEDRVLSGWCGIGIPVDEEAESPSQQCYLVAPRRQLERPGRGQENSAVATYRYARMRYEPCVRPLGLSR